MLFERRNYGIRIERCKNVSAPDPIRKTFTKQEWNEIYFRRYLTGQLPESLASSPKQTLMASFVSKPEFFSRLFT